MTHSIQYFVIEPGEIPVLINKTDTLEIELFQLKPACCYVLSLTPKSQRPNIVIQLILTCF